MDCYFIISGVPKICVDHADKILNLALGLMFEAKQVNVPQLNLPVMLRVAIHSGPVVAGLRIAIHSGPVVAGVLGKKKIRYGVVGETVNITKRLLLNSEPGKILVTNSTRLSAAKSALNAYEMSTKGYLNIGNKQATCTYYLEKNTKQSIWELTGRSKEANSIGDGYKEVHCPTVMQKWINIEADIRKQERVIEALQNKTSHFSGATEKLRKMRESFRSHHHSNDSGFSAGSGTESSSSICTIT
uniref:Guanylate cyclase domain-containing protein n=1 Tax=Panagrolaimus sp. PS1159 TaxID=55785 RepID=A0AC35EVR4_9BILA